MKWIVKRSSELYVSSSGLSKASDQFGYGFPFLSYKDVFNNYYTPEKLNTLVNSTEKDRQKCSVKRGDVFLTRTSETTDELGMSCVALKDYENATFNGFTKRLRPLTEEIVPEYAAYFFRSSYFRAQCQSLASLITRASLNDGMIRRFKIRFPKEKKCQEKIGKILLTYDSLIENNTKRIRILEKMAENLYKEWFVRFRFPGYEKVEFADSKYGKLPNTFEIVRMKDVFDYYIGGGWGEENESDEFPEVASVIRGADFPNVWHYDVDSCPRRFHKTRNYKARRLEAGDIIMEISGGTSEQPVGRTVLVTKELVERFEGGRVICASFCKLIRLNKEKVSPYYFYYWMKFLYDTRIIDRFQLQSTGIINFKFEPFLRKGDVMLPAKEIMEAFGKKVMVLHQEMNLLAKQNTLLARQRDLLLPRLMSGKLEV